MTPVLIDYESNINSFELTNDQDDLITGSIVVTDFSTLKNQIERARPHYRRQISFRVEKSLSKGECKDTENNLIYIEPTEDNLYRIITHGVESVMNHVPNIIRRFHDNFVNDETFSIANIENYESLFHEATGAILIQTPEELQEPYKKYFNENRVRNEGNRFFGRGANYYRQYISELKHAPNLQIKHVQKEINEAMNLLLTTKNDKLSNDENLLQIAVKDNLR